MLAAVVSTSEGRENLGTATLRLLLYGMGSWDAVSQ